MTGLTWQQVVDSRTFTWADAVAHCQNLNLAGTGWRLPTVKELLTLVDVKQHSPAIDRRVFALTPSEHFWSATPDHPSEGRDPAAFDVNFDEGSSYWAAQTMLARVRCVR